MLVMTAKVDKKKIIVVLAVLAAIIASLVLMLGGNSGNSGEAAPTASQGLSTNDERVRFLTDLGWKVANSPTETSQVKIPKESGDVFERYNALQKSQGYDLSQYAGKTVMRYVYTIENYPNATAPVYATLLIYKNQIIGGDITNTAPGGAVQGFQMGKNEPAPETSPSTVPSDQTVPQTQP